MGNRGDSRITTTVSPFSGPSVPPHHILLPFPFQAERPIEEGLLPLGGFLAAEVGQEQHDRRTACPIR